MSASLWPIKGQNFLLKTLVAYVSLRGAATALLPLSHIGKNNNLILRARGARRGVPGQATPRRGLLEGDPAGDHRVAGVALAQEAEPALLRGRLEEQGHGTIIVLSSVAGERVRQSNYVYGSSKAALDGFSQGLGDSLEATGVNVMVVRPGFVHSSMTDGKEAPPLSTTPEAVADAVVDGLASGKHTVWVPGTFRYVMSAFRHLPRPLWRKLSARM